MPERCPATPLHEIREHGGDRIMNGPTKDHTATVLDGQEVANVLSGTFYRQDHRGRRRSGTQPAVPDTERGERPLHYKVICISLYNEDLARLDRMVEDLKERGFTKANRSALIRFALEQVDITQVKKGL
jgi:hypothetical protein